MKVAFGKLGRSMPLTPSGYGYVGGDFEPIATLVEIARSRPNDQFYLLGRNSGEDPKKVGLPANIFNPWLEWGPEHKRWMRDDPFDWSYEWPHRYLDWHANVTLPFVRDEIDQIVMWVGQHGTSNTPLPVIGFEHQNTSPFQSFLYYVGYVIRAVNAWRDVDPINREPVFLNSDPRNTLKLRDMKWPLMHPVLTQYDYTSNIKHCRYGDPTPPGKPWDGWTKSCKEGWCSEVEHVYSRLECCGVLPGTVIGDSLAYNDEWKDRCSFGITWNEARWYAKTGLNRLEIAEEWVMPLHPNFFYGVWHPYSQKKLGIKVEPLDWTKFNDTYHSVRSTFTTPSSGSGWPTTKIYEAMACGTACFIHYVHDDQKHIFEGADPLLEEYLRVYTPTQLKERVDELNNNEDLWRRIVKLQREHYDRCAADKQWLRMVNERLDG